MPLHPHSPGLVYFSTRQTSRQVCLRYILVVRSALRQYLIGKATAVLAQRYSIQRSVRADELVLQITILLVIRYHARHGAGLTRLGQGAHACAYVSQIALEILAGASLRDEPVCGSSIVKTMILPSLISNMYHFLAACCLVVFLLFPFSSQTNIEYWDSMAIDPIEAHIIQRFRNPSGGECCVPVDLSFPRRGRKESFIPYRVVFERFANDQLYVFANAAGQPACRGPAAGFYQQDDGPQRSVKDFRARPTQRWSGALFLPWPDNTEMSSPTHVNETESKSVESDPRPGSDTIRYPWSISYRGLIHYAVPPGSLNYVDINRRSHIRGVPQFGEPSMSIR